VNQHISMSTPPLQLNLKVRKSTFYTKTESKRNSRPVVLIFLKFCIWDMAFTLHLHDCIIVIQVSLSSFVLTTTY